MIARCRSKGLVLAGNVPREGAFPSEIQNAPNNLLGGSPAKYFPSVRVHLTNTTPSECTLGPCRIPQLPRHVADVLIIGELNSSFLTHQRINRTRKSQLETRHVTITISTWSPGLATLSASSSKPPRATWLCRRKDPPRRPPPRAGHVHDVR